MLEFNINNSSSLPVYMQFANYLIQQIKLGELNYGKKLPSDRVLSKMYNLSRNTINATLYHLQVEGYIERIERKGTFISYNEFQNKTKLINWDKKISRGSQKIAKDAYIELSDTHSTLNLSRRHPEKEFNFINYLFENMNMKTIDTKRISNEAENDRLGVYELREAICDYMKPSGINAKPDEVLVFSSITQILNLLASVFLNVGVNYYHEKYSFVTLKDIMAYSGANFKALEMDSSGIIINPMKEFVRPLRNTFLHIQPCDHNPTGITLSNDRRKEIVEFCAKQTIPIIEMDSMRNLYHKVDYPPALKSYDKSNSIIYIGSFLRPTSEAFNLAWIYADKHLINKLSRLKMPIDIMPSPVMQVMMANAIKSGLFDKYLSKLRGHLASQLNALDEAMKHYLSDYAEWDSEQSAYYLFPKFEKGINIRKMYNRRVGVDFNPGFFYYAKDNSHISMTTLSMSADKFPIAVERLRSLITK